MIEMTGRLTMTPEQIVVFGRLTEAASRGDGDAACQLGDMYREAQGGLRYSPKLAFHWYARSAMAGDAGGQNNLGACYEHGLGRAQSYPKAVRWYRLSVAQGLGTATMNLGYCYLRGHGVPADKGEALRLFRLAVEQGEPKAADNLERRAWEKDDCFDLPEPGSPEDQQINQCLRDFWKRHAAGEIRRPNASPLPPVPTPREESYFGIYESEGIEPDAVAPAEYRTELHRPDRARLARRIHTRSAEPWRDGVAGSHKLDWAARSRGCPTRVSQTSCGFQRHGVSAKS